jgi:hypothetical protein
MLRRVLASSHSSSSGRSEVERRRPRAVFHPPPSRETTRPNPARKTPVRLIVPVPLVTHPTHKSVRHCGIRAKAQYRLPQDKRDARAINSTPLGRGIQARHAGRGVRDASKRIRLRSFSLLRKGRAAGNSGSLNIPIVLCVPLPAMAAGTPRNVGYA